MADNLTPNPPLIELASPARAVVGGGPDSPVGAYPQFTPVPLSVVAFDPLSCFEETPAGLVYVANAAGYFRFSAQVLIVLGGSIQAAFALSVFVNGMERSRGDQTANYTGSNGADFNQSGNYGLTVSDMLELDAGDQLAPYVLAPYRFAYTGGGDDPENYFSCERIC